MSEQKIDVCLSPALLDQFDIENRLVVVIDVLRATSTICVALSHGAKKVVPVMTLEECKAYEAPNHILAAERGGIKPDGFHYGNSPFDFMNPDIDGKMVFLTTTNGTKCIERSKHAAQIITAAFINCRAVVEYIRNQNRDVLLFCAGWKNRINMEDTLCAGAICFELNGGFELESDSALAAKALYEKSKHVLLDSIVNSSHFKRLAKMGIEKDIEFCMNPNMFNIVPVLMAQD